MEVHLLPSLNPDGWLRATEGECGGQDQASGRLNEAGVDLNRDFPTRGEDLGDRQPETRAAARFGVVGIVIDRGGLETTDILVISDVLQIIEKS